MAAAGFPPELKAYKRFLVQANQIQKVDPKVAYYCRLYALTKMLAKPDQGGLANPRDPAVKDIVNGIMANLESAKKAFDEPLDPEGDFEAVKTMAENVFANADSQDRDGEATIRTSHAFMTSFVLYEVLEQFGDKSKDPEIQQKCKYAKWKAADIAKAIKEGRKPTRGGPNEELGDLEAELGDDQPAASKQPERQPSGPASAPDDDDEPKSAGSGGGSFPDLPPPPRGQSFKRLPPPLETKKDDDLPNYLDVSGPGAKDDMPKTPRSLKVDRVVDKVKKKSKSGINPKDAAKMKKLKEIEVLAREALSAIRFNDVSTAKGRLRDAIQELDRLNTR
jgi:vacuolar protein sorting-associated protein VTA1